MALCTDAEHNRFVNCSLHSIVCSMQYYFCMRVSICSRLFIFWFYLGSFEIILAQSNLFDPKRIGSKNIRNILRYFLLYYEKHSLLLWFQYKSIEEEKKSYKCHKFIARVHQPHWELHVLCFRMYAKSPGDRSLCDIHTHTQTQKRCTCMSYKHYTTAYAFNSDAYTTIYKANSTILRNEPLVAQSSFFPIQVDDFTS